MENKAVVKVLNWVRTQMNEVSVSTKMHRVHVTIFDPKLRSLSFLQQAFKLWENGKEKQTSFLLKSCCKTQFKTARVLYCHFSKLFPQVCLLRNSGCQIDVSILFTRSYFSPKCTFLSYFYIISEILIITRSACSLANYQIRRAWTKYYKLR